MYRDFPILKYDGRPSIYHGTGQKASREWNKANNQIYKMQNNIGDMEILH